MFVLFELHKGCAFPVEMTQPGEVLRMSLISAPVGHVAGGRDDVITHTETICPFTHHLSQI